MAATAGLFSHGPDPLENTLAYAGDPGLFGLRSVTWPVLGDPASFVGGIRAILVQAAHPEVVAGVRDHSRYRHDPLGRLSRTSAYVTGAAYGAGPEVDAAVRVVSRRHRPVAGMSHRGLPYRASSPDLAAWVHNTLVDSFLFAHQGYGPARLSDQDADRFVAEQAALGRLLDADPLPTTAGALSAWVGEHPSLGPSPGQREAVEFLSRPPLSRPVRIAYGFLFRAAVATVPPSVADAIGTRRTPGDALLGRAVIRGLRWALGPSPAWQLAQRRVAARAGSADPALAGAAR